jgi:uncharacterized protein (TIGR02646 family)
MIAIKNYFADVPATLLYDSDHLLKTREGGLSYIAQVLQEKEKHKAKNTVYGAKDVRDQLHTIYNNRCAYCESFIISGAYLEVEHFRPKSVYDVKKDALQNHTGYYWLTYEWSNLLLACPKCNGNKSSKFPIAWHRAKDSDFIDKGALMPAHCQITHEFLAKEQPLLLHPVLDKPDEHLRFLKNGSVEYKTLKGFASIEVYGLNRDELIKDRKAIIEDVKDALYRKPLPNNYTMNDRLKGVISGLLKLLQNPEKPYKAFVKTCLLNFNTFFIDDIEALTDAEKQRLSAESKQILG